MRLLYSSKKGSSLSNVLEPAEAAARVPFPIRIDLDTGERTVYVELSSGRPPVPRRFSALLEEQPGGVALRASELAALLDRIVDVAEELLRSGRVVRERWGERSVRLGPDAEAWVGVSLPSAPGIDSVTISFNLRASGDEVAEGFITYSRLPLAAPKITLYEEGVAVVPDSPLVPRRMEFPEGLVASADVYVYKTRVLASMLPRERWGEPALGVEVFNLSDELLGEVWIGREYTFAAGPPLREEGGVRVYEIKHRGERLTSIEASRSVTARPLDWDVVMVQGARASEDELILSGAGLQRMMESRGGVRAIYRHGDVYVRVDVEAGKRYRHLEIGVLDSRGVQLLRILGFLEPGEPALAYVEDLSIERIGEETPPILFELGPGLDVEVSLMYKGIREKWESIIEALYAVIPAYEVI